MKINKKRFIPIIVLAVVIIILVVVIINIGKKPKSITEGVVDFNTIDLSNVDRVTTDEIVFQENTTSNDENLDSNGQIISEGDLNNIKSQIKQKFATYSKEAVGMEIEPSEGSIIFNSGITNVNGKDCLIFNVYGGDGEYMKFYAKYAMSTDCSTLYFFNSEYFAYILIK